MKLTLRDLFWLVRWWGRGARVRTSLNGLACSPFSDPDVMRVKLSLEGTRRALDVEETEAAQCRGGCAEAA